MIDQNRDGFIDNEDLKDMLASLGNSVSTFCFLIFVSLLIFGPLYLLYVVVCDCVCHGFIFPGQEPNDQVVDGMMSEAPGPLNFTMFLTLFGEKLTGMCCIWHLVALT